MAHLPLVTQVKSIKLGNMTKSLEREREVREQTNFNTAFFRVKWHKGYLKFLRAIVTGFYN